MTIDEVAMSIKSMSDTQIISRLREFALRCKDDERDMYSERAFSFAHDREICSAVGANYNEMNGLDYNRVKLLSYLLGRETHETRS